MTDRRGAAARRAFRVALVILPIGVLGNIVWTLLATDRDLLRALGDLPWGYLLVALGLTLVPWITGTLRLMIWSRFLRYRIPFRELLRMTLVVDIGAAVSPTAIGGEAFRWGMLVKRGVKPGEAASLALMPKVEDFIFFAIALPVAITWSAAWRLPVVAGSFRTFSDNALITFGSAALLALIAWLVMHGALLGGAGAAVQRRGVRVYGRTRRRLRVTLREARRAVGLFVRRGKRRFAITLALTGIHWIGRYSVIVALALFLGVPFDPVLFWLLQWVVFTIMSFVPTPGATGGAEVAFSAVYATLLPAGTIGLATAAWRLFTFYVPAGGAAVLFLLLGDSRNVSPDNDIRRTAGSAA